MPRRERSDDEDGMRTCPHCGGLGIVHNDQILQGGETQCPVCGGEGRVTRTQWQKYVERNPHWGSR